MRIALLCPGPSLVTHDQRAWRGKLRMGVNSVADAACFRGRLDYWAGLDKAAFELYGPGLIAHCDRRGWALPKFLTEDQAHSDLMGDETVGPLFRRVAERGGALKVSELRESFVSPPPVSFPDFTLPAALVWCVRLGADEVHIYGADMRGIKDYRGVEGANRDVQRWEQERAVFNAVRAWVGRRGIDVQQHSGR